VDNLDPEQLGRATAVAARALAGSFHPPEDSPAIAHALATAALVLEHGGSSGAAMAALVRSALAAGDPAAAELVVAEVGAEVADLAQASAPPRYDDPGPWRERTEAWLERLRALSGEALLLAACAERHDLGTLVGELHARGLVALGRIGGDERERAWYCDELVRCFSGRLPMRLQLELDDLARQVKLLIQGGDTQRYDARKLRFED